jgi:hypothetical protein
MDDRVLIHNVRAVLLSLPEVSNYTKLWQKEQAEQVDTLTIFEECKDKISASENIMVVAILNLVGNSAQMMMTVWNHVLSGSLAELATISDEYVQGKYCIRRI